MTRRRPALRRRRPRRCRPKGTGTGPSFGARPGRAVTLIAEAVFARCLSAQGRAAARPAAARPRSRRRGAADFVDDVEQALYASKLVSYAQGFDMITVGSQEYGWDLDLGESPIWRGGCIIRAAFLDRIKAAYERDAEPADLLLRRDFSRGSPRPGRPGAGGRPPRSARHPGARLLPALAYYDGLRRNACPPP